MPATIRRVNHPLGFLPSVLGNIVPLGRRRTRARRSSYGGGSGGSFWGSTPFLVMVATAAIALTGYGIVSAASSFMEGRKTGSTFSYVGSLERDGVPVNDTCDFRFGLFRAQFAGDQIGKPQERTLAVKKGVFSAYLDFGKEAMSVKRPYLDLQVRCPAGQGEYMRLLRKAINDRKPFDIMGLAKLVEATFGPTDVAPGPEGTSDPSPVPLPISQYRRVDTTSMGAKGQDTGAGHQGAKRAAAMFVPEPGTYAPGEKRELGEKGIRGQQFFVSQAPLTPAVVANAGADALAPAHQLVSLAQGGQQKLDQRKGKHGAGPAADSLLPNVTSETVNTANAQAVQEGGDAQAVQDG